jgi:hypothetical protein
MITKNKVYIHVAIMNTWEALLSELLEDIRISQLDRNAEITLVSVGGNLGDYSGCRVINTGKPLSDYEHPTIDLLHSEVGENENIMYCHLKGVSRPDSLGHRAWRRELIDFNIIDWQSRISHLQARYTSGARVTQGGAGNSWDYVPAHKHYSGNFWWARSDFLKMLPPPEKFRLAYPNRFAAEAWIGQCDKINEYVI